MKARPYHLKKLRFREGRSLFLDQLTSDQKRRAREREERIKNLEARIGHLEKDNRQIKREMGIQ